MKTSITISGIGMTTQGRAEHGPDAMAMDAVRQALRDADLDPAQVGMVFVGNALGGLLSEQACIKGQAWLHTMGLGNAPIVNIDNGCASGTSALHMACLAVEAGQSPVLVVGVEKMWTGDRAATHAGIEHSLVAGQRAGLRAELGNESGSVFMGLNSVWAERQMNERETTVAHFAATAAKARRHAAANPLAQHRRLVTDQEVLDSTAIVGPLTRLMCSSFTDGAAALVLQRAPKAGAPRIVTSILISGDGSSEYHARLEEAADLAWKHASIGPADVDLVEVHDATSAEELYALESLGFYEPGGAGPATLAGETSLGSEGLVVNPSGGLVARGHPIGATGVCQVFELAQQLRGDAGDRQIAGARIGASVNTGGIISRDVGCVGVHVLAAGA